MQINTIYNIGDSITFPTINDQNIIGTITMICIQPHDDGSIAISYAIRTDIGKCIIAESDISGPLSVPLADLAQSNTDLMYNGCNANNALVSKEKSSDVQPS